MKTCSKCGLKKSLTAFHRRTAAKDGLTRQCKACTTQYNKAYYRKNETAICARGTRYYMQHSKKVRARHARRRKEHPEQIRAREARYSETHREERSAAACRWSKANPECIVQRVAFAVLESMMCLSTSPRNWSCSSKHSGAISVLSATKPRNSKSTTGARSRRDMPLRWVMLFCCAKLVTAASATSFPRSSIIRCCVQL